MLSISSESSCIVYNSDYNQISIWKNGKDYIDTNIIVIITNYKFEFPIKIK